MMDIEIDGIQGDKLIQCDEPNTVVNQGLPPLNLGAQPVSYFEFWPTWVFYLPVFIYWVFLSLRYRNIGLPMAVNPNIELGGMVGESKLAILDQGGALAQQYILPYVLRDCSDIELLQTCDKHWEFHLDNAIQVAAERGINFPFVVKPELGCRGAGVRVINNRKSLGEYLRFFPKDRRYIMQKLAPYTAEAGVFYERFPGSEQGRVTSLTLKYRPVVVGDGKSTLKMLIKADARASILREKYFEKNRSRLHLVPKNGEEVALGFAGSHCKGSIFRNGNAYISAALSAKIDAIMRDFPEFHYGRLDVKFRELSALQRGEDFVVIEVNGVSSEKTHIWDSRSSLISAFATLFEQYNTLFCMGNAMTKRGFSSPSVKRLIATWWRELQRSDGYPSTD